MGKRRISLIVLLAAGLIYWVGYLRENNKSYRYECHIQANKVVVNTLSNKDLVQSFSVSMTNNKFGYWRHGMDAPVFETIDQIRKDYFAPRTEGYKPLLLIINRQQWATYEMEVTDACYEALGKH